MFNEEIKERYIKEKKSTTIMPKTFLEDIFKSIESYEIKLNKDACNFTTFEITEYYSLLNISSLEFLKVMNNQLALYTEWCQSSNLVKDNQNHYREINIERIRSCLNTYILTKKIISKETLTKWCSQLPNYREVFILMCLFEGIKGKDFIEITHLKIDDINEKEKTVKLCTGRTISVSDEFISIALKADQEMTYYRFSENMYNETSLLDLGYIFKYYLNTDPNLSDYRKGRSVYNAAMRIFKYLGISSYATIQSIYESGKVHYVKEYAKQYNLSVNDFLLSEHRSIIEEKFNCTIVVKMFMLKYSDCL